MEVLGIDIGGSGIKGAVVDTVEGGLLSERKRVDTPQNGGGTAVLEALGTLVREFAWTGPVGCGFPGVMRDNVVATAANLPKDLIGVDLEAILRGLGASSATVWNDADAAAFAEMRYGSGRSRTGVVLVLTLGTGIGSALFVGDCLVPNTEFGHLEFRGGDAEQQLTASARKSEGLSWEAWGERFSAYLGQLEALLNPAVIILGGGTVKKYAKFAPYLATRAPVELAHQGNLAGILGAAAGAAQALGEGRKSMT